MTRDEWLKQLEADAEHFRLYANRVKTALESEGFDPKMLDNLPVEYIMAALILRVK